jgi:hypothetical protein
MLPWITKPKPEIHEFLRTPPVGAAEGCDLLILLFKDQSQKIAAFGSSYARACVYARVLIGLFKRRDRRV